MGGCENCLRATRRRDAGEERLIPFFYAVADFLPVCPRKIKFHIPQTSLGRGNTLAKQRSQISSAHVIDRRSKGEAWYVNLLICLTWNCESFFWRHSHALPPTQVNSARTIPPFPPTDGDNNGSIIASETSSAVADPTRNNFLFRRTPPLYYHPSTPFSPAMRHTFGSFQSISCSSCS